MAQDPEDLEFLQSLRPRSSIVAAMTARGRTLGTLTLVTAWSKRRYTADDVSFAQVLARRIGLALDSAGLFSDLESVERRLDTVMSMLDEAITVHDASGDLVYANHAAARWLGFTSPQEIVEAAEQELMGRLEIWAEDGTQPRPRSDRAATSSRPAAAAGAGSTRAQGHAARSAGPWSARSRSMPPTEASCTR